MQVAVLLCVFVELCPRAFALNPALDIDQYAHKTWAIREGFSNGVINAIAQTPDGYLWLGTEFGLLRFDGIQAVPWSPPGPQALPGSFIIALFAARDGTLWIGTRTGLASWNGAKLSRYPEFDGRPVASILEDRGGELWVGVLSANATGRLCSIRGRQTHCYGEDGSFGNGVLSLYEDTTGNLWAGDSSGLWRYKPDPPTRYATSPTAIQSIIQGADGKLLMAMSGGVRQLVSGKIEPYPLAPTPSNPIHLLRDRDGGLWIATFGQGLIHVHQGRTDVFSRADGLSSDAILSVLEDREGNIWVATTEGLDRFRELPVITISSKQGLSGDRANSVLAARDGSVWLSGFNGLDRWKDGRVSTFRKADGLPGDLTTSLFEDDGGRLWVATRGGLARFEAGRFVTVDREFGVDAAITGDAEHLWVSLPRGLLHFISGRLAEEFPWPRLASGERAQALAVDRKRGGLWLGFYGGSGVAYFQDGQVRARYTHANGLGGEHVADVQVGRTDALWAATDGGLSVIQQGRIQTLSSKNGLPCDSVHWRTRADDRSVWLYMSCGLVRIAEAELDAWMADPGRTVRTTVFEPSDGVRVRPTPGHIPPQFANSPDGKLWFVTIAGVSVIDPVHLPFNKLRPPVHIEEIVGDDKTLWQNLTPLSPASARVPALTRRLEIRYTALSFAAPEKIHFKYMLEGYDRGWMEAVNKRDVTYTNLPPRNYRFRVIASNNSGVWNETGDTLEFSIAPAYYQTNWFRALAAALILAFMGAVYQFRVWRVQRESRRLRDVIETIPAYVWSAEPDGSIDFVNRRWLEFSGFSLDRARGWGWADALHPEDRARLVEGWQAAVASGQPMESEARMRGADGEYRWLLFRSVPQRDGSGKIIKWYGKSMDITELKRAEEERERMHELEADLAHMNRVSMMGELSASIAHEVNQPLAGIVSNGSAGLRFLDADAPDLGEIREALRDIVRDGKRAGEIIRRIRALTKRTELPREKLDLNETIVDVLALVGDEAKKNSVTIRTQFADEISPVHGDRVQLQQVLLNLVMNAIQAMSSVEDRERRLAIATQNVDGGQVQVTVRDSGTGLDPDKIAEIFEPFYTTKSGGMGMGLSICRSILQNHGGRLWATANEGPGASFHFTLPKHTGEESSAEAAAD